jgi:hypothetical protein
MSLQEENDLQEVRNKHAKHGVSDCEKYFDSCPICYIIVTEQKDKYLTALEEEFGNVVKRYWNRWNDRGYNIATNISSQELAGRLALTAYYEWIRPKFYDIEIDDDELYYVRNLNKKRIYID